jgi:hypothetical protein
LSFNQNDILVSSLAGGSPIYQRRFALSPASALESSSFVSFGGVAVVTRTNGNHELWVAAEGDYGGIHIFPMTSAGQVQFTNGSVANANVPAASCTMTFDPATRRVLFGNMTDPKVYAMDVETHALVQTYTIPAGNGPGWAEFTGITTGSNGVVVAIEAWDNFSYSQPHRFGLSVWNADGSNYRFINLDGLAGYDMVETNSYISPINILWTGNAVQSRLANLTRANGSFGCDVTGVAGLNYVVQAATNLAAPIWEPITTNTAPFQFSDPASATLPARFYRAVRQ